MHTEDTTPAANAALVLAFLEARGATSPRHELMDALLRELRERHGLDPARGLQLLTASALLRRAFDPGMALVIVPEADVAVSTQSGPAIAATAAPTFETEPPSPSDPDAPPYRPQVLPGRHGHGADPAELLRRLYPAGHPLRGLAGTADEHPRDDHDRGP